MAEGPGTKNGRLKPSTLKAYANDISQYQDWLRRHRYSLVAQPQQRVQQFLDELVDEGRRPTSVRRAAASLRHVYKYLGLPLQRYSEGHLEYPAFERAFRRSLPESTIEAVRHQLQGPKPRDTRNLAIFELLYACGVRVSEIVALDVDEIRLREKLIRPTGKGGVTRVIPFGGAAEAPLRKWLQQDRAKYLVQTGSGDHTDALLVNRQGTRIARQSVQRTLSAAGVRAGIAQPIAPHMIRDSCAREMLDRGATPADVNFLFGHVTLVGHKRMDREAIERLRGVMSQTHPSWSGA